jgi:protein phosphatase
MSDKFNNLNDIGDKKKALIILVGPPASGKSTWGKKFALDNSVVYVSTDTIRKEIGAGEGDQTVSAAAFGIARSRVSAALGAGKSAMIDATSVNRKARKDWINLGKGHSAFIIAVAFEVPRDELLRRDAQRERTVGPEIIDRFVNKYERPTEDEVDRVIIK